MPLLEEGKHIYKVACQVHVMASLKLTGLGEVKTDKWKRDWANGKEMYE